LLCITSSIQQETHEVKENNAMIRITRVHKQTRGYMRGNNIKVYTWRR